MSFRHKLTLSITSLLVIVLVFIVVVSYRTFIHASVENEREFLIERGYAVAERYRGMSQAEWIESLSVNVPDGGFIRLVDDDERTVVIKQDPDSKLDPERIEADDSEEPESRLYTIDREKVLLVRVPLSRKDETTIEIAEPLTSLQESITTLMLILIAVSAGAVVILFLLSHWFSRLLLKPISRLSRTMKQIEESLTFQQVPAKVRPKDELYQLTATFNRMMRRIQDSYEKQQQFVSDASHELRTPLTILEGYANMLRRWGFADAEQGRKAAETIYAETVRMRGMTEQLLALADSEREAEPRLEPVDAVALCRRIAELFESSFGREIDVVSDQGEIVAMLDASRMQQMLFILLDNAVKYSQDRVDIRLRRDGESGRVEITVRDRGIGIPEEELERVFERFYRVDPSRQRKTGGAGLGLAIARNIVLMHGGRIELRSAEGEGTDVIVRLPTGA